MNTPAVKRPLPMLVVMFAAGFVAAFNENAVNVALVDIMAEFSVNSVTAQWLVTGYMIVTTVAVVLSAYLSRRVPLRPLFFAAGSFFAGGCLLAAFAPTFPLLLALRALQACGTGLFVPLMMNSVLALAPREKLGFFMSLGGSCITLGPAFGPVVSGVMATCFGWRFVFVPPCAVMAILMVAGAFLVQGYRSIERIRLDPLSLALIACGLILAPAGLTMVASKTGLAIALILCGAACIGCFGVRQAKTSDPLLDIRPLKKTRFSVACLLTVVAMMTTFSMSVLLPLYFGGALLQSALASGLLILVPIMVNVATSLFGGRIMDSRGEWPLLPAGFALIAIGQLAVCLLARESLLWPVVIASTVVYAGVGFVFSPSQAAGLKHLDGEEHPHGVAIMNTFIQFSACLGPSLYVGILSVGAERALASGACDPVSQALGFSAAVAVAAVVGLAGFAISVPYARRNGGCAKR